jgi:hypothetical protein
MTPKVQIYEYSYQTKDIHLLKLDSQNIRNFWFYPDIFRIGLTNLRVFFNNLDSRIQINKVNCSNSIHKIYLRIFNLGVLSTHCIFIKYISNKFPNIYYLQFSSEASLNHILGYDGYDEISGTIFDDAFLSHEILRDKSSHQKNQIRICVQGNKNKYKRLKNVEIS